MSRSACWTPSYFEQALSITRELGTLYYEAITLTHLGDTHHATGNTAQARSAWQQTLDILHHLGHIPHMGTGYPDTDTIRANLRDLD
jgi:hypothetical protein